MHIEPMYSLAIKRVLLFVSVVALAVIAVSCDRESPLQATGDRPTFAGTGGTTGGSVTFSARATGAKSTVLGTTVSLCGAGPLPPQGGEDGNAVLAGRVEGVLAASLFHSIVVGHGDRAGAQANAGDLDVMVAGQRIQGHQLTAGAQATCVKGTVRLYAGSGINDLRINGKQIFVTGAPNQTIWLPLGAGRIVINEQTRGAGSVTVRALRIILAGSIDVTICEAHAGITCGTPDCSPKDFVTGGGWITGTPTGSKATFGVSGGIKNGEPWGHLAYVDHGGGGVRVKGTGVTSYGVVTSTTRHIEGTCEVNGQGGFTYQVDVADNGEPGTSDMFRIRLSNGYQANGTLQGGNIQLHTPCR
jgi:hypothetical protein